MRWIGLFGLALIGFLGCSLDDALENAPCNTGDDCLGQECVFTQYQAPGTGDSVGYCRSDGMCAAGYQEGCMALNNTDCPANGLTPIAASDGVTMFCCPGNSIVAAFNGDEALCVSMEFLDAPCSTPMDCSGGEGFVCTRTLEQEEELQEELSDEQQEEPGLCRPTSLPECSAGVQEGCRTDDGCPENKPCTEAGRCYCCDRPTDSSRTSHIYLEDPDGASAACIDCPGCDMGDPCTRLEEGDNCDVADGELCGCTIA